MNPIDITASVTAVSNAMACKLTDDQLELAGAVFTQLGDTLTTISVMRGLNKDDKDKKDDKRDDKRDDNKKARNRKGDTPADFL